MTLKIKRTKTKLCSPGYLYTLSEANTCLMMLVWWNILKAMESADPHPPPPSILYLISNLIEKTGHLTL
jgi:hypothetical protein